MYECKLSTGCKNKNICCVSCEKFDECKLNNWLCESIKQFNTPQGCEFVKIVYPLNSKNNLRKI